MGDIKVKRVKNRKYITWEKMYRIYQTRCFAFRFLYFHSTWTDRCKNIHRRTIHTRTTRPCRTIQPVEGRLCQCNCNSKVRSNSEISTGVGCAINLTFTRRSPSPSKFLILPAHHFLCASNDKTEVRSITVSSLGRKQVIPWIMPSLKVLLKVLFPVNQFQLILFAIDFY